MKPTIEEVIALGEKMRHAVRPSSLFPEMEVDSVVKACLPLAKAMQRVREILGPKLAYALTYFESPYNVMIGPITEAQARELSAIFKELGNVQR